MDHNCYNIVILDSKFVVVGACHFLWGFDRNLIPNYD